MTETYSIFNDKLSPDDSSVLWYLAEKICGIPKVLVYLLQDKVVTSDDYDFIMNQTRDIEKDAALIRILIRKWPSVMPIFVQILLKTGNEHCVDVLIKMLSHVSSRRPLLIRSSSAEKIIHKEPSNQNTSQIDNNASFVSTSSDASVQFEKQNTLPIVLEYLTSIDGSNTISGIYLHPKMEDKGEIETIFRLTSKLPWILSSTMPDITEPNDSWNSFITRTTCNWKSGSLIHMGWLGKSHPLGDPVTGNRSVDDVKWKALVEDGGSWNKKWKEDLDFIAHHLKRLQIEGVVVVIDLLRFINNEYSGEFWRGRPGINGSSKLYQITRDYLTQKHGLHSLLWAWSLLYKEREGTNLKDFWPGREYVDVVTVYLLGSKSSELYDHDYKQLLDLVENKTISINKLKKTPSPQFLKRQPRWAWFTIDQEYIVDQRFNTEETLKATFQSTSVINKHDVKLIQFET